MSNSVEKKPARTVDNRFYRQAQFLISAGKAKQFPQGGSEVAFSGRSNAGKSSAINTLCDNKGLARTSKTPGRTRLVNFFELDEQRRLVDLPGYGFAKVPIAMKNEWEKLMTQYLSDQQALKGLVIIMDIRHPLNDYDWQMLEWCRPLPVAGARIADQGRQDQARRPAEQQTKNPETTERCRHQCQRTDIFCTEKNRAG